MPFHGRLSRRKSTDPPFLMVLDRFQDRAFEVKDDQGFNALALDLFHLHCTQNPVYRSYLELLRHSPSDVSHYREIPMLPIELFREHRVLLDGVEPELVFTSSGTTDSRPSRHFMGSANYYERTFLEGFHRIYGPPEKFRILGLLPAYLERSGSSLVYMVDKLIQTSGDHLSGTYLDRLNELADVMDRSEVEGKSTLLIGVSFALLDLAETHPMPLKHTTIVETGGMKGRRRELVRSELHERLQQAFGPAPIHSEYGMTELSSQAWSTGHGLFSTPPWMRVLIRETNDPFTHCALGRTGGIDMIDLANIISCPFIATQDLGKMHADGSFEVLGRFDHSDVRGCNLMVL